MRTSSSVARRHFAQFDDELQDSYQTISTTARHVRPRTRLPTVADTSDSSSGRLQRRRFPTSAFFSDSTDDDVSRPIAKRSDRPQLYMSACSPTTHSKGSRIPLHMSAGPREDQTGSSHVPRLHVSAIQFPATRSVLWDRRKLSTSPIVVSLEQVLPRFIITAEILKEVYRLYKDKSGVRGSGAALCYLYGGSASKRGKNVVLEGVKMNKEEATTAGMWCIPVYTIADGNTPGLSQETYVSTIKSVQSSYRDEYSDNVASKLPPKLLVFRSSPHAAQLDFQLECAASPVLFKFSLVRNLPLLMTPLAASLTKREFSTRSGNMRSGYLTLDRTRKAVPLLKVDPLVLQQPVVGVWVYGVQIDDAWDEETARRQLADPFLYFACIGYLMSEAIKERVGPEKNTFLVAIYPVDDPNSGSVSSLPRFFECSYSEFLSPPGMPLPMELYSHRQSCLVGMSKFSSDVELTLSAAPTTKWEEARRQVKIPTAPRSTEIDDASDRSVAVTEEEKEDVTSGWTITADANRKITPPDANAQSQSSALSEKDATKLLTEDDPVFQAKTETPISGGGQHDETCTQADNEASQPAPPNETEEATGPTQHNWAGNTSSYRSCCKTQQLLTIQHQQILENQQRQLHEMQEQIAQLRRLLRAARSASSNKKQADVLPNDEGYVSDASSSSIGAVADVSNVSSTFSRHGNDRASSYSSMVSGPRRSQDGSLSGETSNHTEQGSDDDKGEEEEDNDFSLSSLGLSSISSGSDAELSSLSSSLVSKQSKKLSSSRIHEKEPADTKRDEPELDDLSRSQVSQVSIGSLKTAHQSVRAEVCADVEPEKPSEIVCQEVEKNPIGYNLSISELSSSSKEANREADKAAASDDDRDASADPSSNDPVAIERLLPPDAYLRKVGGFVDHHGGCFTTPPLDFHSFCVPRIKFSTETPECSMSDSEDEEIRLIEQKYKRLMAA